MLELGIYWVRGVENATPRAKEGLREQLNKLVPDILFEPLWCREDGELVPDFHLNIVHPTEIEHLLVRDDRLRFFITFRHRKRKTILVRGIVLRQKLVSSGNSQPDLMTYVLYSSNLGKAFQVGAEYTDMHILHPSLFGGARGQVTGFIPDQMPFAAHAAMAM